MVGTVPGEQGTPGFSGGLSGVAKKNRIDTPDLRKGQCWGPTARSPTGLATRPRLPCGAGGHPVANVSSQRVSSDTRGPRNPASGGSPQLPQRGGTGEPPRATLGQGRGGSRSSRGTRVAPSGRTITRVEHTASGRLRPQGRTCLPPAVGTPRSCLWRTIVFKRTTDQGEGRDRFRRN